MLLPLAYLAATYNLQTPAAAPKKPEPSPYDPPSGLAPGVNAYASQTLVADADVKISRHTLWILSGAANKPKILRNLLLVETGDGADHVHVRNWPGGKVQILINGKSHIIDGKEHGPKQNLWIETKGGNDTVIIDDDVTLHVDVEGGDGDDYIQAGGGRSRLHGGNGNDFMRLGSGLGYAAGNNGDDTIIGGAGNAVMYGNKGNDRLYGGFGSSTQQSYLDGGDGNDELHAGSGHSVLHGGNDDDHLVGYDRTTFYAGKGCDHIWNNQRNDLIYANATDRFDRTKGSSFTEVKPSNAGEQGYTVQDGEYEFKQQTLDDLELLRSSPIGQQALAKMDELAAVAGGKVTIAPTYHTSSAYWFGSTELENLSPHAKATVNTSKYGYINNGVPGSRADRATIYYNPFSITEVADRTNTLVPVSGLFHEMSHAYNGATGTFLEGTGVEYLKPGKPIAVTNKEFQAVGLPNEADPFDFDNDPSTRPTTVNPQPFTENALHKEMGKPLRPAYSLKLSSQGRGL
ncbi:M91 family zinc metallopeptidase [Pseudomonas antarctica]|uniref:M91 family zinc metallopeptidase n=1 Tax=Pseudomonas antarctica TaxID=219572 RepID=UPI0039C2AB6C